MCLSGQFSAHLGGIDNYHTCTTSLSFLQFVSSLGLCFTEPCCSVQFGLLVAFVLQLELPAPVLKLMVYVANLLSEHINFVSSADSCLTSSKMNVLFMCSSGITHTFTAVCVHTGRARVTL